MHGPPQRTKIERTLYSQPHKSARPQDFQRPNHLCGRQPQIQRRNNHADFEAAILQQNVIH